MLATGVLLILLVVATATDVRQRRIYNWTTYPGMLVAVGLNALGTLLLRFRVVDETVLDQAGWIGVGPSLLGLLACGFVLLVCFVFLKVGGGDVKLMAMIGAFLGPDRGVEAMLWTFVLGGAAALVVLVWTVGFWRLVYRAGASVYWTIRLGRWTAVADEQPNQVRPPLFLAPCALAAVLMVQFSVLDYLAV